MLSLALETRRVHRPPIMTDGNETVELELLGGALKVLRNRAGVSQALAGEKFGTTGQGWAKYENARAPSIFKPSVQERLAQALGFTLQDFQDAYVRLKDDPEVSVPRAPSRPELQGVQAQPGMVIRETIQAGYWLEADDLNQGWHEEKRFPAAADPRYPAEAQYVAPIVGDSMNLERIFDGDFAHLVDIAAVGHVPVSGNIVEVERVRFGGQLREFTLKQIEVTPKGVILWPRSSNTRWSQPLDLREGVKRDEDIQVRVRGLLLNVIRRF